MRWLASALPVCHVVARAVIRPITTVFGYPGNPECFQDGKFQNWSRRAKVNGKEYPNEEQPNDSGYYVNGYVVSVADDKVLWTEWRVG